MNITAKICWLIFWDKGQGVFQNDLFFLLTELYNNLLGLLQLMYVFCELTKSWNWSFPLGFEVNGSYKVKQEVGICTCSWCERVVHRRWHLQTGEMLERLLTLSVSK